MKHHEHRTSQPGLLSLVRHVVVAMGRGRAAEVAIRYAMDAARVLGARVTVVHVAGEHVSPLDFLLEAHKLAHDRDEDVAQAQTFFDAHCKDCPGVEVDFLPVDGRVPDRIVEAVRDLHGDLLVVTTHGRHGLARAASPSVCEILVRNSPCPVLSVHVDA